MDLHTSNITGHSKIKQRQTPHAPQAGHAGQPPRKRTAKRVAVYVQDSARYKGVTSLVMIEESLVRHSLEMFQR